MSISRVYKFPFNKLLIASNNPGKVNEIKKLLQNFDFKVISLIGKDIIEPEETEVTFAGNAILKAKYYGQMFNMPALADDSGISLESLEGFPGVYSARVAGEEKDYKIAFEKIKAMLAQKKIQTSRAHFSCALALWLPSGEENIFEGRLYGSVEFPAIFGDYGFGYAPIFKPDNFEKRYSELDDETRNEISHRAQAFQKFINYFS